VAHGKKNELVFVESLEGMGKSHKYHATSSGFCSSLLALRVDNWFLNLELAFV
jgi:hypothetical protein